MRDNFFNEMILNRLHFFFVFKAKFHSIDVRFLFIGLINLRAALIYDAVMVFATAISELGREQVLPTKVLCDDPSTNWNKV